MATVLTLSVFNGSIIGHGGEKRTEQIKDLVSSHFSHKHLVFPFDYHGKKQISFRNKISHSLSVSQARYASEATRESFSIDKILSESHKFHLQRKTLEQHREIFTQASTVIWENNYDGFFYQPYLIKKMYGTKIIACPQNIESLVPRTMTGWLGKTKLDYLKQDLEPFRVCDEVFTISEEDQWLFNLLDIKAKYLPSFPAGDLFQQNLRLRESRALTKQKDYFLILGTVGNPPTRSGMNRLLRDLQSLSGDGKYEFCVVGFGTEVLKDEFDVCKDIKIIGSVDQSQLELMMRECKAMIINQDYCPGALTKVPEILISGIPVIMNTGASRSYKRMDGVFVYETIVELLTFLNMEFTIPVAPLYPKERYKGFIDAIE